MVSSVYSNEIVFPNSFVVDNKSEDGSFARISIYPLQSGFGITLGNILRRTLLSSIRGMAIRSIRINGVVHEYCTMDGVIQNVSEIIYNLRRVVFNSENDSCNVKIKVSGKKKVYASDIQCSSDVKVLNPKHFLFEITGDREVEIDIHLVGGIGDIFVEQNNDQEVGEILLDQHYSPVLNVKTTVLPTRVEERTDYDKLILEIKTNGSVQAEEALKISISILKNFLNAIESSTLNMIKDANEDYKKLDKNDDYNYNLFRRVNDLELSVRSLNCLNNDGIEYLGDLVNKDENDMLRTPNFGRKSLNELKHILSQYNLSFGMDIKWRPDDFDVKLEQAKKFFAS